MSLVKPEPPPRPLTGGAVMATVSRVTVAITGAATTIFVARLLGPAGAGGFAIGVTVIAVLSVLCALGIEHGIAYFVSAGRWHPRDALGSAQRIALAAGLGGAGAAVLARIAFPSAFGGLSITSTAVVALAMPFALSWFFVSFVGLAIDRYEAYVLPPALLSALAMVLVIAFGLAWGLGGALAALTVAHALVAVATGTWAKRSLPAREPGAPQPAGQLRAAMRFGLQGYGANALQLANARLDLFILSAVASAAAVGHYAVAIAVTTVLWLVPQALSEVLFPRVAALSASAAEGARDARAFVEVKSLRHTVALVIAAIVVLTAPLLVLVVPVYGEAFRPAVTLGLILLPGVALLGIAGVLSASIVGRGKPIYSLYTGLVVTPLTVVAYAVLVPAFAAQGAALAKSLSYAATFALTVYFYRRVSGAGRAREFLPTRSEFDDYRLLAPQIRAWAAGLRRRR